MTITEIITKTDVLVPNQYNEATKLSWLSQLDGRIFNELIKTHLDPDIEELEDYHSANEELLVPHPYGDDMYVYYLAAKIAAQNAETAKYNQFITLYNSEYQNYCDYYNRTHMPKPPACGNRFHY